MFIGSFAVIVFAAIAFSLSWVFVEKAKTSRARRVEAEKQAHVMTVSDNGETWIRDTDTKASWRNLTGTPALYVNGQQHNPQDWEVDLHRYRLQMQQKRAQIVPGKAELIPENVQPIDLLTALETVQRCLIVGASDSGKTTLLQWLIHRRLQTSKTVTIDPHAFPGKWGGYVIGTGRNYPEIGMALSALLQIMTKRYDEIGKGIVTEGNHPGLTILIDEWRAITQQLGKPAGEAIKALLTESRKAAFSVFVATHSDRAKPLGLEGEYDLKDGFAIVRLSIANGIRQATIDTGNGEQPATLPGPFPQHLSPPAIAKTATRLKPTPSNQEAQILSMFDQGASYSQIARKVYGSKGGKQVKQIKQVLNQYN